MIVDWAVLISPKAGGTKEGQPLLWLLAVKFPGGEALGLVIGKPQWLLDPEAHVKRVHLGPMRTAQGMEQVKVAVLGWSLWSGRESSSPPPRAASRC